jgi:predicted thioredoxin/glutaredoxin
MRVKIYKTKNCPKCATLMTALHCDFESVDMTTPEALTELRINGIFSLSAPILQVGEKFYTVEDLFDGENLRQKGHNFSVVEILKNHSKAKS